jgi:hypothetical protein
MAYCSECGTEILEGRKFCGKCGVASEEGAAVETASQYYDGNVTGGIFIVISSFFSLPYTFLGDIFQELRELSIKGRINSDDNGLPFTGWLLIAGKLLITVIALLWLVIGFIFGVSAMFKNQGLAGIGSIFFTALGTFCFIWLANVFLELLSISLVIAKNTEVTARNTGSPRK